jgi:hypothetical protein
VVVSVGRGAYRVVIAATEIMPDAITPERTMVLAAS